LIRLLAHCASKGVNYLLNVGPDATGSIPRPSVERLEAVGRWMRRHGESIYGTQQNPFACEFSWGRVTCKPGHLYLHLFEWPKGKFALEGLENQVLGVRVLSDQRVMVPFRQTREGSSGPCELHLALPAEPPDPHLPVVAIDVDGALSIKKDIKKRRSHGSQCQMS
jgi:alpha-L-fucosidase